MDGIVDDLRARLAAERTGGAWSVLGVSLGGMVALSWCARFPGDFARAVVVNTSAADLSGPHERLHWRAYGDLVRAARSRAALERERMILELTVNDVAARAPTAVEWAAFVADAPVRRRTLVAQLLAAGRARSPATLPVPLLVLASFGDRLVAPACSWRLAARYGAELAVHPTAGHDLTRDAPEWVTSRVVEWSVRE